MSALTVAAFPPRVAGNPYCELLYRGVRAAGTRVAEDGELSLGWVLRNRGRVQVLHLHWPELYYRGPGARVTARSALAFAAAILAARALGYRIVWTVHNALPHEGRSVADRALRRLLLGVARVVVQAESARRALPRAGRDAAVVPHGHYIDAYPHAIDETEARRRLGLPRDATVLVCFGQVRAYKGIPELLGAFAALDRPDVRLVVAGRPVDPTVAGCVALAARVDHRIVAHLDHVADEDVQTYFEAADWVVLPYREVLTSGSALLALSFGRPVVTPRAGCLADLADAGGVLGYAPEEPDGLAGALAAALATDARAWRAPALAAARRFEWEPIARAYARVFAGA